MARGSWDDFTEKHGFNDGEATEGRDFRARTEICKRLNELPEMMQAKIRAVEFDRPGMHNGCLIAALANPDGLSDEALLNKWLTTDMRESELPDGIEISEIISDTYDEVDNKKE
jgi:hypothetical protein